MGGRDPSVGFGRAAQAGIGLRSPHVGAMLAARPPVGWLEVHPENYMADAPAADDLADLRQDYPLSLHGVGLSLAGPDPLDWRHLARLADLVRRFAPVLVSEHLSWSTADGVFLNDLLPIPYTGEALARVASRVDAVQVRLGRAILIENPSRYLDFAGSEMSEPEFLAALAARTGCGLLLDVNNVHVSARNLGFDAAAYLDAIPADAVGEIHLAGHAVDLIDGMTVLIDTHGASVSPEVWSLYRRVIARIGPRATLIEWDRDLPPLEALIEEARRAERVAARALAEGCDDRAA